MQGNIALEKVLTHIHMQTAKSTTYVRTVVCSPPRQIAVECRRLAGPWLDEVDGGVYEGRVLMTYACEQGQEAAQNLGVQEWGTRVSRLIKCLWPSSVYYNSNVYDLFDLGGWAWFTCRDLKMSSVFPTGVPVVYFFPSA